MLREPTDGVQASKFLFAGTVTANLPEQFWQISSHLPEQFWQLTSSFKESQSISFCTVCVFIFLETVLNEKRYTR